MKTIEERFWSKVNKNGPIISVDLGPCWIWTGARNGTGKDRYGIFKFDTNPDRKMFAHRFAWFLATGGWPYPCALHHCDNPLCVRFDHLWEGTHTDNRQDCIAKGRNWKGKS